MKNLRSFLVLLISLLVVGAVSAQARASLTVIASEGPAQVLLSGRVVGVANPSLTVQMPAGRYDLVVRKPGMPEFRRRIALGPEGLTVQAQLGAPQSAAPLPRDARPQPAQPMRPQPAPAPVTEMHQVSVSANVAGAQVSVNGVFVGQAPIILTLADGSYQLSISAAGFQEFRTNLFVSGPVSFPVALSPLPVAPTYAAPAYAAPPVSVPPQPATPPASVGSSYQFQFYPLSGLVNLRAAVRGPDRFIVAGNGAVPYSSYDGRSWTAGSKIPVLHVTYLSYGNGLYIATGDNGGLATSSDGVNWTARNSGSRRHLTGSVWTGSQYVVTGQHGTLLTSTDGATWISVPTGLSEHLMAVEHRNGTTVAAGYSGSILFSRDGRTWNRSGLNPGRSVTVHSMASSPGGFVVATSSADGTVYYSADGSSWSEVYRGTRNTGYGAMFWDGANYLVLGSGHLLSSADGRAWSTVEVSPSKPLGRSAVGIGTLVVTSGDGTGVFVASVSGPGVPVAAPPAAAPIAPSAASNVPPPQPSLRIEVENNQGATPSIRREGIAAPENGECLAYIENGSYAFFGMVNFGSGYSTFRARVSTENAGGRIEVRLDAANGPLAGSAEVRSTGSWSRYTDVEANLSGVSGLRNLYLVFVGGHGYLFNVNWVEFSAGQSAAAAVQPSTAVSPPPASSGRTYRIGDAGPAGGLVFYDKGNDSGGWRYLEAATKDISDRSWADDMYKTTHARDTAVGGGLENTRKIAALYGKGQSLAADCLEYREGGYSDWYMPSKDELHQLYLNLYKAGKGNFSAKGYPSSTEVSSGGYLWMLNFANGRFFDDAERGWGYSVRPIRRF